MMLPFILIALFAQFQGLSGQTVDANGVSLADKVEAMELRLLSPGSIDFGVSPCSNLLNDNQDRGEQTAAEWTRIIFHDSITADISAGTGGLDASIGFESDREENIGVVFVNATLGDFAGHSSIYRSISDVIALGLAASMISCDTTQPLIKLRAGRIDATGPGPAGVPGPFDTLDFATTAFAKAGFSNTEMIQAVACGHSLGAVHRKNFPTIVGDDVITAGSDGNATFDSTPFVFDNSGVTEYIFQNGTKGGPLVVGANVTGRSDFRIFNSDNNATIRALQPADTFRSTCFAVFEKMLNTVPRGVVLSDPIVPRQWILREGHLDLDLINAVRFIGVITTHSKTVVAPTQASWFFGTNGGGNTGTQLSATGAPHGFGPPGAVLATAFGPITDYPVNQTLGGNPLSAISFNIATASAPTTAVYTKPLNPNIFILVSTSAQLFIRDSLGFLIGQQYALRVAVRSNIVVTGSVVTATLYYPTPQQGTVAPKYVRQTATMTLLKTQGDYKVFQAFITQAQPVASGASHIDVKLGTTQSGAKVATEILPICQTPPITAC